MAQIIPDDEQEVVEERVVVRRRPAEMFDPGRIICYLTDFIEAVLLIRFVLRAAGANSGNGFVSFMYALTAPLVAPFPGIFPNPRPAGYVIEWSTPTAMLICVLIAILLVRLLRLPWEA